MQKITGKLETIKGDFTGNKIPLIECPARGHEKACISGCRPSCCKGAEDAKVFIDYGKGICAVECGYKPPTATEVFKT